jgi:hypothetical protein
MSWTKVGAILPLVLASCAQLSQSAEPADAGVSPPSVSAVEPQPGPVPPSTKFTVRFSAQMDEGPLLAASGRSETVVLAAAADVERVAAAIEHSSLSAHERALLVPAQAELASDVRSIQLKPDKPLPAEVFYLLVSPRVRDAQGRHMAGKGARFEFQITASPQRARLISPQAGAESPVNLVVLRAFVEAGLLALVDSQGTVLAGPVEAQGDTQLSLCEKAPCVSLKAGERYRLSLNGVADEEQTFTAAPCSRDAPPALQGGAAQLTARDTSVAAQVALDWPARVGVLVGEAPDAGVDDPCLTGVCASTEVQVTCAPPACGPQSFSCTASLRLGGLHPATEYSLRVVARDDLGFTLQGPQQRFSTLAALPRLLISEIMAAPPGPAPRKDGEYVEILNLGPGAAAVETLALEGGDGVVRPVVASPPPLPVQLQPGARALAVGSSFDGSRYPTLPPGTPILRASTQGLLGRGLPRDGGPPFRLLLRGAVPVELAHYPGNGPKCPEGASLQRDESAPPEADGTWRCGPVGGTPGTRP